MNQRKNTTCCCPAAQFIFRNVLICLCVVNERCTVAVCSGCLCRAQYQMMTSVNQSELTLIIPLTFFCSVFIFI